MTVTGEKRKRKRNRTPKKKPAPAKKTEYILAYTNPRPDPVKQKRKPKPPKGDPVFFMQQEHIYDDLRDDTILRERLTSLQGESAKEN